mmetsp:Transcript_22018/g.36079  ORF Transcript_22018/g.36079 Transcript_22018/m.36079 type:complete len:86 (-) Transcript_22018:25-282(-)
MHRKHAKSTPTFTATTCCRALRSMSQVAGAISTVEIEFAGSTVPSPPTAHYHNPSEAWTDGFQFCLPPLQPAACESSRLDLDLMK